MKVWRARLVDQFERYVEADPNSGCWLWSGPAWQRSKYGIICGESTRMAAHRWAYAHFNGPLQPGLQICHRCDTPQCVNPAHLYQGTARENARDCVERGRKNAPRIFGSRNGAAKLTTAQWQQIAELRRAGMAYGKIARTFGVTASLISHRFRRQANA